MSNEEPGGEPTLTTMGDLSLVDLTRIDHPILARALHRVLTDTDNPEGSLARFENFA